MDACQPRREFRGRTKPPIIWDVVVLIMGELIDIGFPTTALGVYLQFDTYIRPLELCAILAKHIAFPRGTLLGSQASKVLVLLPRTKTGPLQSVTIRVELVVTQLRRLTSNCAASTRLFPSYRVYRSRFHLALKNLGLEHIGYSSHSIRHGEATMDLINSCEGALPEILYRGRWESKLYLQSGAAALLFAEIPLKLLVRAYRRNHVRPTELAEAALNPGV